MKYKDKTPKNGQTKTKRIFAWMPVFCEDTQLVHVFEMVYEDLIFQNFGDLDGPYGWEVMGYHKNN